MEEKKTPNSVLRCLVITKAYIKVSFSFTFFYDCHTGTVLKPVNFCWTEIDTSAGDKIILILIIINLLLFPLNM